jgi:hypothetical protein
MKILVFGLSGTGKSSLARQLQFYLGSKYAVKICHFEGAAIREMFCDWNFSPEGHLRQMRRIKSFADQVEHSIADFLCPTKALRDEYGSDYTIWMNTDRRSKYKDTDSIFEPGIDADQIIVSQDIPSYLQIIAEDIWSRKLSQLQSNVQT